MPQEKEYWAQGMKRLQEIKDAATRETFEDPERNWLISECQKLYSILKKAQKKLYSGPETEAIKEPCPFCKVRNTPKKIKYLHIYSEWYDNTKTIYYKVVCLECGAEGPLVGNLTPRQAVKSWDERTLVSNDVESRLHGVVVAAHTKYGCEDGFATSKKDSQDKPKTCPICEIGSALPPINAGMQYLKAPAPTATMKGLSSQPVRGNFSGQIIVDGDIEE